MFYIQPWKHHSPTWFGTGISHSAPVCTQKQCHRSLRCDRISFVSGLKKEVCAQKKRHRTQTTNTHSASSLDAFGVEPDHPAASCGRSLIQSPY